MEDEEELAYRALLYANEQDKLKKVQMVCFGFETGPQDGADETTAPVQKLFFLNKFNEQVRIV